MKQRILRLCLLTIFLATSLFLLSARVHAAGETCGLELLNVPVGATIRVSAYWTSDDPDEAIEDEGYVFQVIDGGSGTLSIWRQPFTTYTMVFPATGSRVAIGGHKDPASSTHSEGLEVEGCVITATINSLPPWVKDYSRNALPYLGIGGAGLMVAGNLHPGLRYAGGGVLLTAAIAKKLADDPIDCSSPKQVFPADLSAPQLPDDGTDPIVTISNRIMNNATNAFAIANAAVANANRANCPDFSADQRQRLFDRAQTQGERIGNHVARLENQLTNLVAAARQAGIALDEFNDCCFVFSDWWFSFADPDFFGANPDDALLLQVMTQDELQDLRKGIFGTALLDVDNGFARRYPDVWPDGALIMLPALDQWSSSLQAKESGL